MARTKQQTHAKRARELAVKERRELKRAKKAERRAAESTPEQAEPGNSEADAWPERG